MFCASQRAKRLLGTTRLSTRAPHTAVTPHKARGQGERKCCWAGRAETGKIRPWANWLLTGWEGGAFQGLLNTQRMWGLDCKLKQLWDEWRDRVLFHYELGNKVFGKKANSFLGEIPLHKLQIRSPIKGTAQIDSLFHSTYHCWSTAYRNQRERMLVKIHILERYKHSTWTLVDVSGIQKDTESKVSTVHPVWAAHLLI